MKARSDLEHSPSDELPGGSNLSDNPMLDDIVAARVSRRGVLVGLAATSGLAFLGSQAANAVTSRPAGADGDGNNDRDNDPGDDDAPGRQLLGFEPVATSRADSVTVAAGYTTEVLIPWGTPISSTGPAWRKDASNTAAEQLEQVGMHHDGMHFFPLARGRRGSRRGLLVLNHEYVDRTILYRDADTVMTREKVDKAVNAHGVTVVEIALVDGAWSNVDSPYNRRINGITPVVFSGPVPGAHPMLQSELGLPARGTLNNCSHGVTPWGTYLTGEENWNGYFGTEDPAWTPTPLEARYGVTRAGFGYRWHLADQRFDLARNRNELNRFGWVVEINPFEPTSTPVKRTALGRVKHEGATCTESRGRVVVYTGDDEDRDYLYRYVSQRPWRSMRARGISPLDEGELTVAKFNSDGTGEWLPLVHGQGALTAANGWADQADVLIRTRQAADAAGATKLDRPEWNTVNPKTGDLFVSLTSTLTDRLQDISDTLFNVFSQAAYSAAPSSAVDWGRTTLPIKLAVWCPASSAKCA